MPAVLAKRVDRGLNACNAVEMDGPTNMRGRASEVFSDSKALSMAGAVEAGDCKHGSAIKTRLGCNAKGKIRSDATLVGNSHSK